MGWFGKSKDEELPRRLSGDELDEFARALCCYAHDKYREHANRNILFSADELASALKIDRFCVNQALYHLEKQKKAFRSFANSDLWSIDSDNLNTDSILLRFYGKRVF